MAGILPLAFAGSHAKVAEITPTVRQLDGCFAMMQDLETLILSNFGDSTKQTSSLGDTFIYDGQNYEPASVYSVKVLGNTDTVPAHAFENCAMLASVTFENEIKRIGEASFKGCSEFTILGRHGEIAFEDLTEIGKNAFENCKSLPQKISLEMANKVGGEAFKGSNIEYVILPKTNITLGSENNAFVGSNLKTAKVYNEISFLAATNGTKITPKEALTAASGTIITNISFYNFLKNSANSESYLSYNIVVEDMIEVRDNDGNVVGEFTSLGEALTSCVGGETIIIKDDLILQEKVVINKSVTIVSGNNLGVTLTRADSLTDWVFDIMSSGVTFGGASQYAAGNIKIIGSHNLQNASIFCISGNGRLRLDGIEIKDNFAENGGAITIYEGKLDIENSTILACKANGENGIGGAIYAKNTSVVTIKNSNINGTTATNGGAIYLEGQAKVDITNSTISNTSSSENGGAIYVNVTANTATADVKIYNSKFSNGSATNGGAIYVACGLVEIDGGAILDGNTASENGGAIYIGSRTIGGRTYIGQVDIYNAIIGQEDEKGTSNSATLGGGVYVGENGVLRTLKSNGVTRISGNNATNGAGVYFATNNKTANASWLGYGKITSSTATNFGGGVYVESGRLDISSNFEVSNNTASEGAGIYAADGTTIYLMQGAKVSNNTARENGGGVALYGTLYLYDATIGDNNTAGANGGGVYVFGGKLYATNAASIISGNTASGNGGGVYVEDATQSTKLAEVEISSGATIVGNKAQNGAGLHVANGKVTLRDGNILDNVAANNGGGIYATGDRLSLEIYNDVERTTLENSGSHISGNSATLGGGIYVDKALKLYGGTLENNVVSDKGGAMYVATGSNVELFGGRIFGNWSTNNQDYAGIFVAGATKVNALGEQEAVESNSLTVYNAAKISDRVFLSTKAIINVKDKYISSKHSKIYIVMEEELGDNAQIKVATFASRDFAGAGKFDSDVIVFTKQDKDIYAMAGIIRALKADENGNYKMYASINDAIEQAKDNEKTYFGLFRRQVINSRNTVKVAKSKDIVLVDCRENADGAVVLRDSSYQDFMFVVKGSLEFTTLSEDFLKAHNLKLGTACHPMILEGNKNSSSVSASMFYVSGGTLKLSNETTVQNSKADQLYINNMISVKDEGFDASALGFGGVIWMKDGEVVVDNSTFDNCSANGNGGMIYQAGGTVTITNSTIRGGSAKVGGAIYSANGEVRIDSSSISNCSAQKGGAVAVEIQGALRTNDVTFKNNSATAGSGAVAYGGAIYLNSSNYYDVKFTNFISNSTNGYGGAIYVENGSLNLNKTSEISTTNGTTEKNWFEGNTAKLGGALFACESAIVTATTATFKANYATESGGACYFAFGSGKATLTTSTKFETNGKSEGRKTTNGGAIYVERGNVEMIDSCSLTGNEAINGGSVYVATGGKLTISQSTFRENIATVGGAIVSYGALEVKESTMSLNSAGSYGGALAVLGGTTKVNENKTTFSGNTSQGVGGAIYVAGGEVEFVGSQITGNSAARKAGGGAIYTIDGTTTLKGVTVTGNTLQDGSTVGAGLSVAGGVLDIANGENANTISNGDNATIAISDTTQSKPGDNELEVKSGLVLSGDIDYISDGIHILNNKSFVSIKTAADSQDTPLFRSTKNETENVTKMTMKRIKVYLEEGKFGVNDKILQFMPNDQIDTGKAYINYFNLDISSGFGLKAIIDETNGNHADLRAQNFQVYGKKNGSDILYAESETLEGALADLVILDDGYSKYLVLANEGDYVISETINLTRPNVVISAKGNVKFTQTVSLLGFGVTQSATIGYDSDFEAVYGTGGCGVIEIVVDTGSQFEGNVFVVDNGATLTLSSNLKITSKSSIQNGSIVLVKNDSHVIIASSENASEENNVAELMGEATSASSVRTGIRGGLVYVENSTFTMTSGKISKGAAEFGGAVYAIGSTVTISGGTISGNYATYGGGLYADTSCNVNITGGNISSNTATKGGGVYINGKAVNETNNSSSENASEENNIVTTSYYETYLNMSGGEISSNTATGMGGGMFLNGMKYVKDKNSEGEAIGVKVGTLFTTQIKVARAAATFTGGKILSNTATNGGGIYFCDSIGRFEGTDETYLQMFKNSANADTGMGGAIYVDYGANSTSSQIEVRMLQLGDKGNPENSNTAKYGAGIYLSEQSKGTAMTFNAGGDDEYLSGNIKISDAIYLQLVEGNLAKIRIDKPYNYTNQKITITSPILATEHNRVVASYLNDLKSKPGDLLEDIFEGKDSNEGVYCFILNGNDIIIADRNFYVHTENDKNSGRFYESMSSAISAATGKTEGYNYVVLIIGENEISTNASVTLSGGNKVTIKSAKHSMNGNKHVFTYDVKRTVNLDLSSQWLTVQQGELVLENITFKGNAAPVVEVQNGSISITNVTFDSGNISVAKLTGGSLTADKVTIQNLNPQGNLFEVENASLTIKNSTIENVQATNIVSATSETIVKDNGDKVFSKATVNISNTTISGSYDDTETIFNLSSDGEDNKTEATLTDVTIKENKVKDATIKAVGSSTTLNIKGSSITGNTAAKGGALYVENAKVNFAATSTNSEVTLTGNRAATGGAIYLVSGELTIPNYVTLSGNIATNNGGGVFVLGGTLTLETNISGNTATGNGGGLYVAGGKVKLQNGVQISDNIAANGGGIYLTESGKLTFGGNVTILNNTATSNGGGLCIENSNIYKDKENKPSLVLDSNVTISLNTATNGGGLYVSGAAVTINGAKISDNNATNGGGVYMVEDTIFKLQSGLISGSNKGKTGEELNGYKGGGVYVGGGTFTMTGGTIDGNISQIGGGVYVGNGGTFTMTGGNISSNVATDKGGGVGVEASGYFTMTGGTIGGAFLTDKSSEESNEFVTVKSYGNSATNGGGVYANLSFNGEECNVQLTCGTISYNEAENGGGLYLVGVGADSAQPFDISVAIENNIAKNGGALFVGGNTINVGGNTIKLKYVQIAYNDASEYGGGIYVDKSATLELTNGIIGHSDKLKNGEYDSFAIAGTMEVTSPIRKIEYNAYGTREGGTEYYYMNLHRKAYNSAGVEGGGVYVAAGGTFNLKGGVVNFNFAPKGGGIANHGTVNIESVNGKAEYTVSDGSNTKTGTFANAILFRNNAASDKGGAIYTTDTGTLKISGVNSDYISDYISVSTSDGTLEKRIGPVSGTGVIFVSNKANNMGGAIYTSGSTTINAGLFGKRFDDKAGTVAVNYTDTNTDNMGGAIAVGGGSLAIGSGDDKTSNIKFSDNYSVNGGALAVAGGEVNINNSEKVNFTQNEARGGNGGAIYVASGTVKIQANFTNNKAQNGGVVATMGGETEFGAGTMKEHQYTSDGSTSIVKGGAVYVGGGKFILSGGSIGVTAGTAANKDNFSNKAINGGGVYVDAGGEFTMQAASSIISYNYATDNGGGVYVNGGTFNLLGGNIKYNGANAGGGGLYMNGGTANDNGTQNYSILGNTAAQGGGVYLNGSVTWNFSGNDENHAIMNNTATSNGGGMYIAEGTSRVTVNSYFKGNTATSDGGGIYAASKFTFTGVIKGDSTPAAQNGGGIYVTAGNSTIGGTLSELQASKGGAVYAAANITFSGTAHSNHATISGGALYLAAGGTISGYVGSENTADSNGGGVYSNGDLTVYGVIENNKTEANGGGVYVKGSLTMSGSSAKIQNNSANQLGGGAFLTPNENGGISTLTMTSGAQIANNEGGTTSNSINYSEIEGKENFVNYDGSTSNGVYISGNASISITGGSQLCAGKTSEDSNNFAIFVTGTVSKLEVSGANSIRGASWFEFKEKFDTTLVANNYINGNVNIFPQKYLIYYYYMACTSKVYKFTTRWKYSLTSKWWATWHNAEWYDAEFYHERDIKVSGSSETYNGKIGFYSYTTTKKTTGNWNNGRKLVRNIGSDSNLVACLANWNKVNVNKEWNTQTMAGDSGSYIVREPDPASSSLYGDRDFNNPMPKGTDGRNGTDS